MEYHPLTGLCVESFEVIYGIRNNDNYSILKNQSVFHKRFLEVIRQLITGELQNFAAYYGGMDGLDKGRQFRI